MKPKIISFALVIAFWFLSVVRGQDALPWWNDTGPKKAIVDFVERVTKQGSPDFVKTEERIATFDNDARYVLNSRTIRK